VVDTIKEYAFKVSPYPLILSIENHCSIAQQQKMVEILKETLGEMLDVPPVTPDMEFLPSPEALKNKILIKGKKVRMLFCLSLLPPTPCEPLMLFYVFLSADRNSDC